MSPSSRALARPGTPIRSARSWWSPPAPAGPSAKASQIIEIRAGDVDLVPAGHRHWHGATSTTAMTHIAIQEALDGSAVTWMEKVTDAQYLAGPQA
jgi:hypothetical protein